MRKIKTKSNKWKKNKWKIEELSLTASEPKQENVLCKNNTQRKRKEFLKIKIGLQKHKIEEISCKVNIIKRLVIGKKRTLEDQPSGPNPI